MVNSIKIRRKLGLEYSLVTKAIEEGREIYIINDIPCIITSAHRLIIKCKRLFSIIQVSMDCCVMMRRCLKK